VRLAFVLIALSVVGCDPLSVLGVEERVSEHDSLEAPPPLADDKIEDKHPVYDPGAAVEEVVDGCPVRWNKSGSIVKLDVLPFDDATRDLEKRVFPGWSSAVHALDGKKVLPSMEVVQGLLKPFNDGLYAAVELGAEKATDGSLVDKPKLFREVLGALVARSGDASTDEAAARFAGAVTLTGETASAPPAILARASELVTEFGADALASRPIGFYTWTPALSTVFRRDRFLQAGLVFGTAAQIATVLRAAPTIRSDYERALDLYAGMTGPYRDVSPIAIAQILDGGATDIEAATRAKYPALSGGSCGAKLALLPASESAETRLFRTLFCGKSFPEGTNLLDVLIGQIRLGKIDLTPTANAGWSDRQLYALETLLVPDRAPEKDHLFLTRRYKEKLIETFKLIVTQNRETHVKQNEISFGGTESSADVVARPIDLHPNLPVEPFPTFYLRTARAYRFVENLLKSTMGEAWLASAHRLREDGTYAEASIATELRQLERLLYGFHVVSARAIGLASQLDASDRIVDADVERAMAFARSFADDRDVARDPRVIVPVMVDVEHNEVRYWAVVGVRAVRIRAEFYPGFEPRDVKLDGGCYLRSYVPEEPFLLIGKTIELALPAGRPPPTRDEFRRACDASTDPEAIRAALSR